MDTIEAKIQEMLSRVVFFQAWLLYPSYEKKSLPIKNWNNNYIIWSYETEIKDIWIIV